MGANCGGCGQCGANGACLAGEQPPTAYNPRPCPTSADCAPHTGAIPHWDHDCHPDLYITGQASYLAWYIKDGSVPIPLITTNSGASLPILGQPGTSVVFGNQALSFNEFSGAHILADFWHDCSRNQGVEVSFFGLADRTISRTATSNAAGVPAIGVPFSDALTGGQERVSLVAFPGAFAGGVTVDAHSNLWGAEGNALCRASLWEGEQGFVWLLAGFRYLDLGEDVSVTQNSTLLGGGTVMLADGAQAIVQGGIAGPPPGVLAPNQVRVKDLFSTRNQLYAGQVGMRAERQFGDAFIVADAKVAVGDNVETIKIIGSTAFAPATAGNNLPAGLLAATSNANKYTHSSFAVVPQVGLQAGYYMTSHVRAYVGYDFLYWTEVIRPGENIDRVINRADVPTSLLFGFPGGPNRPVFLKKETDFWAQGVSFGLDFTY
jgi:hypothetical protein